MEDGQYLGKIILAVQLMLVVHLYISPQWSLHIPTLGGSIEVVCPVNARFLWSVSPWQRRRCPVHLGNPQCPHLGNWLLQNCASAFVERSPPAESAPKTRVIFINSIMFTTPHVWTQGYTTSIYTYYTSQIMGEI